MRFTFKAADASTRGVRVIAEIPDIRLARLEGLNGIGKTLAARLLELISGSQPFAALPRAWDSLVSLLGRIEIQILGLDEGPIVVDIDSARWEGRSQEDCARNPGDATLNGRSASWDEIRKLIQIRRIAGDEGLTETLARTLRERSIDAADGFDSMRGVVDRWSIGLDAFLTIGNGSGPDDLENSRQAALHAQRSYAEAHDALLKAESRNEAIKEAAARLTSVSRIAQEVPDLIATYAGFLDTYETALANVRSLEERLEHAGAAAVHDSANRAAISKWRRLLRLRETAFTRAKLQEQRVLSFLHLSDRPSDNEYERIVLETEQQLSEARLQLRTSDLAGEVRGAARAIEGTLGALPASADDETVADLGRAVTVSQLRQGVARRREVLEGVPRPGQVQALAAQVATLEHALRLLRELPELIAVTLRKQALIRDAQRELSILMGLTEQQRSAREQVQAQLTTQREAMILSSAEAVSCLSRIYSHIDAAPPEVSRTEDSSEEGIDQDEATLDAAEEELDTALNTLLKPVEVIEADVAAWFYDNRNALDALGYAIEASLDWPLSRDQRERLVAAVGDAESEYRKHQESVIGHRIEASRSRSEWKSARDALYAIRLTIAAGLTAMRESPDFGQPLQRSITRLLAEQGLSTDRAVVGPDGFLLDSSDGTSAQELEVQAAGALRTIARLAEAIEDAAARVRDAWGVAASSLNSQTRRMAPRIADAEPSGWTLSSSHFSYDATEVLRTWTEEEIGSVLSSEALRVQLFDRAATVSFDLEALAVHWRTADGKRRRRPLEAFSSGEQVFAYTKAKLESFRSLKARSSHVVVFLDEFGAFVARDRFSELMRFVGDEVVGTIADQVVVMLPASSVDNSPTLSSELNGLFAGEGYVVTSADVGAR